MRVVCKRCAARIEDTRNKTLFIANLKTLVALIILFALLFGHLFN